jgi:uncharacterized protein YndB with AHSA1/START domain
MRDDVMVSVSVDARPESVWHCLTAGRGTWWPEMHFEAAVGSSLVETWIDDGQEASATGTVTHCEAPQLLAFRWIEQGWAQPTDVVILLDDNESSTTVTITETGFRRADTALSLPDEHEHGWRHHLLRLKTASEAAGLSMP